MNNRRFYSKTKKSLLFLTVLAILASVLFSSCTLKKENREALRVNGAVGIDSEVFSYFLFLSDSKTPNMSDSELVDKACSQSLRYLAANTKFSEYSMTLSGREKNRAVRETDSLWRNYGEYLKKIGVSKQTYYKLRLSKAMEDKLRLALYSKNGPKAVPDNILKEYFTQNYVGIKYFYEELYPSYSAKELSLMNEETRKSYQRRKEKAKKRYEYISSLATGVNSGTYTIDEAKMACTGDVSDNVRIDVTVIGPDRSDFSKEFIQAVSGQSAGTAFLVTNSENNYVYFVEKIDLTSQENADVFKTYKDDCLKELADGYLSTELLNDISSFTVLSKTDVTNACLKKFKGVNKEKYMNF